MIRTNPRALLLSFLCCLGLSLLFTNCGQGFQVKNGGDSTSSSLTLVGSGEDPFLSYAWHLQNIGQRIFAAEAGVAGNDLNLKQTWAAGIFGDGIKILVSDDGLEDAHEDLSANYYYANVSKDYTKAFPYTANSSPPKASDDNHATCVSGLIAAAGNNNLGGRGVAPHAKLVSANFLSGNVGQTEAMLLDQANGAFDIFNMSWGTTQSSIAKADSTYDAQLKYGVTNLRAGKGAIYVKAAGNDFAVLCNNSKTVYCIGNSNFDPEDTNPYTILTAALNARGTSASYSSIGSNIWISSFGGEFGDDTPAMMTTDRTGCDKGYAKTGASASLNFENGQLGNANCNYTISFNGTSSATPILSGSIALLLQANPNLSWRDVKYILAKSATPIQYSTTAVVNHPLKVTLPTGYLWEQPWVVNAAGIAYHNWFGFGRVNVDAAVALAKSYTSNLGTYVETNWVNDVSGLTTTIPDFNVTGTVSSTVVSSNLKVEAVQIRVWITHPDISELALELTSPSGTKSIIVNMVNSLSGIANYEGETFLSNAFFQERSAGSWQLRVLDGKSGKSGTLTRWSLNIVGGQ